MPRYSMVNGAKKSVEAKEMLLEPIDANELNAARRMRSLARPSGVEVLYGVKRSE